MTNIEKYKEDISKKYIKEFEEELNFFEKLMIAPITKKMKSVLSSDKEITVDNLGDLEDIGFWGKILGAKIGDKELFSSLTSKTFDFLKKKQNEIILASTSGSLQKLYQEVVEGKTNISEETITHQGSSNENGNENGNENSNPNENGSENESSNENQNGNSGENSGKTHNSKAAGVTTGVVGGVVGKYSLDKVEKWKGAKEVNEYMKKTSQFKESQRLMNKSGDIMIENAKNPQFTSGQKKNFEEIGRKYKEYAKNFDDPDVAEAFMHLDDMGDKINVQKLLELNMSKDLMKAFEKIDDDVLKQMMESGNVDEFKKVFKSHTGLDVPDGIYDIIKRADGFDEASIIFRRILPRINAPFKGACSGLKAIGFLDFAALGLDVFIMMETLNEAEMIEKRNQVRAKHKKNQAYAHMGVAVLGLAGEIAACAAIGSVGGPVGVLIGLGIGGIAYGIDEALDYFRFDKVDFYSQNQKDYLMTERTYIKQCIYQSAMAQDLELNEKMISKQKKKGIDTFKDAFRAMIFLEELLDYSGKEPLQNTSLIYSYVHGEEDKQDFANSLSEEDRKVFNSDMNNLDKIINIRMEYLSGFLKKGTDDNDKLVKSIKNMHGIKEIEKIVSNSEIYYDMKTGNSDYMGSTNYENIDDYNTAYKEKLEKENPKYFQKLEEIFNEDVNHYRFWELYYGSEYFENYLTSNNTDGSNDYKIKNIDFIQQYGEYKKLNMSIEEEGHINYQFNSFDYSWISSILEDIDNIDKVDAWGTQDAVNYFAIKDSFGSRIETVKQVSNLTSQNVIYRIAREFHGYMGSNDELELIRYFSKQTGDNKGFYYDSKRKLNVSGIDEAIDFSLLDNLSLNSEQELLNKSDSLIKGIFYKYVSPTYYGGEGHYKKLKLDSNAEAYDSGLIDEYIDRIDQIIKEELEYSLVSTKKDTEQEIIDFVKNNSKEVESTSGNGIIKEIGYVQLPQNLVIKGKKTGIGNIENYLFKYENNQIIAISTGYHINESLNFDKTNIDVDYEALSPLRESLSPEEKAIVDRVSASHQRLEKLRSLQSGWKKILPNSQKDDLDIPVEIERQMSKKWHDRKDIEGSLLYMTPLSSQLILEEKWEEYYNYFEDTYIGIMATVSQFSRGDKMGNIGHMNSAFAWSNAKIIDIDPSNNELFISNNIELEDDEKYFLLHYIKKTKDEETGKTAEELLKSTDDNEIKKGTWMSKQILISILESETIVFTENGEIKRIGCNVDPKDERITDGKMGYWQEPYTDPETGQTHGERYRVDVEPSTKSTKVMEERIRFHLGEGSITSLNQGLDELDTNSLETKNQTIRKVSESEESGYKKIDDMTANIISTIEKVDRAGRRGDPKFLAYSEKVTETEVPGKFKSRGTSVDITVFTGEEKEVRGFTIDTGYAKIAGLNIKFNNLQEAFRFANIINWIKGHYLKENPDRKGEFKIRNSGKLVNVKGSNITILKKSTVKDYYGSIEDSDTNQSKFLSYINNL